MINNFNPQYRIDQLKSEIDKARQELDQAWAANGKTDLPVLAASEFFDQLMNEYNHLVKVLI